MKKGILMLLLLLSSLSYASWWGGLNGGTRAAIVTGSALILGSQYNQSEYRHQQDLRRLDTQIRRGYERQAVIENANRKYGNIGDLKISMEIQVQIINNIIKEEDKELESYILIKEVKF